MFSSGFGSGDSLTYYASFPPRWPLFRFFLPMLEYPDLEPMLGLDLTSSETGTVTATASLNSCEVWTGTGTSLLSGSSAP